MTANNHLNEIKAIAFDLDGTLVDSIPDLAQAANAMRQSFNMPPLDEKILLSFVGDGIAQLVHRALSNDKNTLADEALWEKGFSFYIQYYAQHLSDYTQAYPQVHETLGLLKTLGLPLAVITNKNEYFALTILKNLNLLDEFSIVIGGDTLTEKKPSAIPLLHVCQVFNIQAEELLMVGDSRNDIIAAKNASCLSCAVDYGYDDVYQLQKYEDTRADFIIHHMSELYDKITANHQK